MKENPAAVINYSFKFKLADKKEKVFDVLIDPVTLINRKPDKEFPDWTKSANFRCPNCPMEYGAEENCPVAVNLHEAIEFFSNFVSFEEVNVTIETPQRVYSKNTSMQDGVSSLFGVLMVTSGCPVIGMLRPMVRYHLPFSNLEETEYRVISMYLTAQYFRYKRGKEPDWNMNNLKKIYEEIKKVNLYVVREIAKHEKNDTSINSVIVLNNFAEYVTIDLDENTMEQIEVFFKDYL
jgi:hypothetical protein